MSMPTKRDAYFCMYKGSQRNKIGQFSLARSWFKYLGTYLPK
jgi:hypothetical protein